MSKAQWLAFLAISESLFLAHPLGAGSGPPKQPIPTAFVIFDLRAAASSDSLNKILTFVGFARCSPGEITRLSTLTSAKDYGDRCAIDALRGRLEKAVPSAKADTIKKILEDAQQLIPSQSQATGGERWISTRGDCLQIFLIHEMAMEPSLDISEAYRDTRLAEDLATALKAIGKFAVKAGADLYVTEERYLLTRTRATLQVAAQTEASPPASRDAPAVGGTPPAKLQATLITGPTEHLFLSVDLPITKAAQVKYDETAHAFDSKDVPTTFYLGADFLFGDVLATARPALENIVLKGLLEFSRHPLDSYGFGLGYRFASLRLLRLELDAFSPFVAVIWTKQDSQGSGGLPQKNKHYGSNFRGGLSFNIDKALAWVK